MIFAGLTSGYIVSQGGTFWVSIPMPIAFQLSTVSILLSSALLYLAVRAIKQNKHSVVKACLGIAVVLGIAFGYFQFKGWGQLFDKGATVSDFIINHKGQYGKYYSFFHQDKEITYDNNTFYWQAEEVSPDLKEKMVNLCKDLEKGARSTDKSFNLEGYGTDLIIKYQGEVVTYFDHKLQLNGQSLSLKQYDELRYFSESIISGRGDFMMIGEYGTDFWVYYKGEKLEYENRIFYRKGQKLTAKQLDGLNSQKNTSSSYIYAFTGIHLLHWLGGVIALIVMFSRSLKLKYNNENYLGITLGSTYWHFLGILWLYLYLFLIFIH